MDHVHRRRFMVAVAALFAGPLSRAQQAGRTYRVAIIHISTTLAALAGPDPDHTLTREILHELRDLGYVEGRNLIFDRRSAEGDPRRYPQIVAEVISLNPDAIILPGDATLIRTTQAATRAIPIVLMNYPRPVEDGLVDSLARPGGNITGIVAYGTAAGPDFGPKTLQLFKEVVPGLKRVAVLCATPLLSTQMAPQAAALGIKLLPVVEHPTDPEVSFARITQLRPDGVVVAPTGACYRHRKQLGRLAYAGRLPLIDTNADTVEAGGLMSYGQRTDQIRRVAHYIDRILRISANVTGDSGNVTDFDRKLGCARKIVVMGWFWSVGTPAFRACSGS